MICQWADAIFDNETPIDYTLICILNDLDLALWLGKFGPTIHKEGKCPLKESQLIQPAARAPAPCTASSAFCAR
jgi:hypothetical protein